ncbi:MAG: DNA gyrase subunit A [SAR202 cluster bacterium]|nr:DNA gyrase subunit A [SAR202 cluster bacterium]|tara:strand:- start:3997 stop:6477 length:2481 start_codon:yes stop_codon:yes gene_type:complete
MSKTPYGNIKPHGLESEMKSSYLEYAMSVIVSRALPDARDGLKPVQRRILYAMHELGMRPNSSHKKSARLVGEVLGKYHPHGDTSVYDAMVRMAQDFSMRLCLVDGQGNFGSIDNDPPAAMRYTEARLSSYALEMLDNLEQDTVDFGENFDATLNEPLVLPARLPNLLVNGASGIAVGMATNIPPHNPTEICNGVIQLIDYPESTIQDLMKKVRGPDFPTGATIMGSEGISNSYETGRGQIIIRATADVEDTKTANKKRIVVTELPYQVNKASLVEKIAILIRDKKLENATEVRDESDRKGMRIVIELRSGSQPLVILNNLYKNTPMQSSFSPNMLALINGIPKLINLKDALQTYIDFRVDVVTRRSKFELQKAAERSHILEGLRTALSSLDEIIQTIRQSQDVNQARESLMSGFDLSQIQAQAILDMQLRRLSALEREKIETEFQEIQITIKELKEILSDVKNVLSVVRDETEELKKKVRSARKTQISGEIQQFNRKDLEAHEQVVVTLSKGGYIKRIPMATYRNQHRGGKGVSGMKTREDDPVGHLLVVDTHDTLLFFTNTGRVLPLTSFELRSDIARSTRGVPIENVIPLAQGETVKSMIGVADLENINETNPKHLMLCTSEGVVKKVNLVLISKIRRAGLIIMNLKPKHELVSAKLVEDSDDIIMVTQQGKSIRFNSADVRSRLRGAGGIKGITLKPKDRVVSMDVVIPDSKLLVISKQGFGKLTDLNKYRSQSRAGSGILTFNVTTKTGQVADAEVIADSDEVLVISKKAMVVRTNLSEIRSTGRATQGVRIFKPQSGDLVASIACVHDFILPSEDKDKKK